MDAVDGYLSDVPTHRSASPSEVSQDLIVSTKALEHHFKEKYSVLRNAYEDRIKRLSEIITATCRTLLSDEIIQEMKLDKVSSVFVLSHASEIIDRHLESDRETYINELLEKISQQDIMLRKKNKDLLALRESAAKVEKDQQEKASATSLTISQLQNQLRAKIDECEKLRVLSEQREQDINLLEQSFQQSAKELALIDGLDKKEQLARAEMKEELRIVSRERQYFQDENYDLRMKLQTAAEEIDRLHLEREQKIKEEEVNRQRITQLMEQVEKTLEQEAQESNLAIGTVHEKMKIFRNRLIQEIQKERKLNSLLQEELITIKNVKEHSILDHRRLQEEDAALRSRIIQEQAKASQAEQQVKSLAEQITTQKLQLSEWEGRCRQLEDRLNEQTRSFQQELKVREESARLEAKKTADQEQRMLEQKTAAFRLQCENEMSKITIAQQQNSFQQVRTSQSNLSVALEDFHLNEVIAHMRHDRDEMIDNHRRTMEEHRRTMETMREELITRHQNELKTEMRRQEMEFKVKYEKKLADAQQLLVQAAQNIDKLKVMVKEGRAVITLQNQRIDHLKKEYDILQDTVLSNSAVKQHRAGHRVAFGSTISHTGTSSLPSSRHSTPVRPHPAQHSGYHHHHYQQTKENQSAHANVSVMDSSSVSMSSHVDKSSQLSSNLHHTITQQQQQQTPQSLRNTMIASVDTPLVVSTSSLGMTTPNANQASLPGQPPVAALTQSLQLLQAQLEIEKQRVQQLEAGIAQARSETELYQQQVCQLQLQVQHQQEQYQQLQLLHQSHYQVPSLVMPPSAPSTVSSAMGMEDVSRHSQSIMMMNASHSHNNVSNTTTVRENVYENGGYDSAQAMTIIDEAHEEARLAKLRCIDLEKVISELRAQLEKAEKASAYLNAQRLDSTSMTQQFGLASPLAKDVRLPSTAQMPAVQETTQTATHTNADRLHVSLMGSEDVSTGGLTMDDHITIPSIGGLVELQEKLEQSYAVSQHWEERFKHQGELLTIAQQELQDERRKIQELRKRERTLFTLLTNVHKTYRQQIHSLRMDLDHIRSVATSFTPFAANEKLTSMNQIRFIFKKIFDVAVKKQEKDMKDLRIAMQSAHNTEISILESKFIEQVNALNLKHTKELEKMHEELLARTERALNASMTTSAGAGLVIATAGSGSLESTMSNVSILASNPDVSTFMHSVTNMNSMAVHSRKSGGDHSSAGGLPAWESVLKGILQGLRDQDAISVDTSSKVAALGEAHQEPSFAANAAARALIGDDIDQFVVGILQKKYGGSPSTKEAAAKLGKELNN